ncbi:hypothetical protein [Rhodococcus sp. 14-2483-1-2]|uniref:hypothetical protein n=1 Tax=Rhodococcus sp. 14-2483-1-2 TaxID=2023147 RepID=UPI000B9AFA40|nr:hypothetical protein [Rhodococcus sp. 14-2483-1-2]OZF26228.1 hypothetical protein CH295_26875 [Rhodococcus sp. 14-2483-1-2]
MTYRKLAAVCGLIMLVVFAAALWRHNSMDDTTATPAPTQPSTTAPEPTESSATNTAPDPMESGTPDAVAAQAMTIAHTWTPGLDTSPNDAFRRAAEYFTPRLTDLITTNTGTDVPPSLQWENWATEHARIIADTTIGCSGCPPDTDNTAHRVATITQTATTETTTTETTTTETTTTRVEPETTIWLTLVRTDTGWLIDELRY